MRKFLIAILIVGLLGVVIVEGRDISDIVKEWTNFSVDISTITSTQIRPARVNRKNMAIYHNGSYRIYITSGSFSVAVSTTTGYPLDSGQTMPAEFFRNYEGAVYGVAISTPAGAQNIRGIELK